MKIVYGIFFAMLLCCPLMAQQSSTAAPVAGQAAGKEVDLSGPWIIDGERVELKLSAEMSTVRKVYCGGDRMTQLKCLWVAENTLRYEVSNQGFGLLNCSASYQPDASEMKGPGLFGNRPTPKGFTAIPQSRGSAQTPGVSTQAPSGPAKLSPNVDAVAKAMASSVNVSGYPRGAGGTKYGLSYLVSLAKSSTNAGGFAAAMSLPDAVVAPITDAKTTKEFDSEWFREMDRLGLSEKNPTRYEAIALMNDINSRQQEYLARAKLVTREIMEEWQPATKFNGGTVLPLVLGVLIIQHDDLFKGGAVQAGVSQTELKKLLSIPQECADAWAAAVSPNYRPIDAAFSLLATQQLFSNGTFDRPLFDRALPSATQLVKAAQ